MYLKKLEDKAPESEMIEDLVALIHSFNGKLYGLSSGKNKENAAKKGCSKNANSNYTKIKVIK